MRPIQTEKCINLSNMNKMNCHNQSSNFMDYVNQSSYYITQSNAEKNRYATLQGIDSSRNDYQQLQG